MVKPSLNLKLATDFLALVLIGCWPEINLRSSMAFSITFLSFIASDPKPMFKVTYEILGTAMGDLSPSSVIKDGTAS